MRCVKRGASKPPTMALRATCRNDEVARKGVYAVLLAHRQCTLALAGLRPTPSRARGRVDCRLPGGLRHLGNLRRLLRKERG
jgi:hypothetical protein